MDDDDMKREIRLMFVRTNLLIRKFHRCSLRVKVMLFRAYSMCLYDIALWSRYTVASFSKFKSCYIKCMKSFFGYRRYDSVTQMLIDIGLPSFNTVMFNSRTSFLRQWSSCPNNIVDMFRSLQM